MGHILYSLACVKHDFFEFRTDSSQHCLKLGQFSIDQGNVSDSQDGISSTNLKQVLNSRLTSHHNINLACQCVKLINHLIVLDIDFLLKSIETLLEFIHRIIFTKSTHNISLTICAIMIADLVGESTKKRKTNLSASLSFWRATVATLHHLLLGLLRLVLD